MIITNTVNDSLRNEVLLWNVTNYKYIQPILNNKQETILADAHEYITKIKNGEFDTDEISLTCVYITLMYTYLSLHYFGYKRHNDSHLEGILDFLLDEINMGPDELADTYLRMSISESIDYTRTEVKKMISSSSKLIDYYQIDSLDIHKVVRTLLALFTYKHIDHVKLTFLNIHNSGLLLNPQALYTHLVEQVMDKAIISFFVLKENKLKLR